MKIKLHSSPEWNEDFFFQKCSCFYLKSCFFHIKKRTSQIFPSPFLCLYSRQSHIKKIGALHNFRIRSRIVCLYRPTVCIQITSAFSFFTFLLKKRREQPFIKHQPHGRSSAECFVYVISLNPHSNPMRKAVLSLFYSSGNPSSGRLSNLPWVTQPLDGLWPWLCLTEKHLDLPQNVPPPRIHFARPFLFSLWYFNLVHRFSFWITQIFNQHPFLVSFKSVYLFKPFFSHWGDKFLSLWEILDHIVTLKSISRVPVI